MKKQLISQIFRPVQTTGKERIEEKVDAMIEQLENADLTGEEIHQLNLYIHQRIESLGPYKKFLAGHPEESPHELAIVLSKKDRGKGRRKEMGFPHPIRLIISILMITLGFAMIIMPAPPYFEMYTIFYFNESDGFTLMDLISLIIVFCGIFSLVSSMKKKRSE